MNFQTLKTQFISMADDPSITHAQAGIWINAAYHLLLSKYDWPFLNATGTFTVVSGTQETAFSDFSTAVTDFKKAIKVWNGSVELDPIAWEDRNNPGIHDAFYITPDNASIGLVPTPSNSTDTITVDYLKSISDMNEDADTPAFIAEYHWILVFLPLVYYQWQQRENAEEFEKMYNDILRELKKFYDLPSTASIPLLQRGFRQIKRKSNSPIVP